MFTMISAYEIVILDMNINRNVRKERENFIERFRQG